MRSVWLAEFIGTFFLVFIGCGSIICAELGFRPGVEISLIFGGLVTAIIAMVGPVSAAHLNPAVSAGFFALKKITFKELLVYLSAEFMGAIAASLLHSILFGFDHHFGATLINVSWVNAFIIEFLGTFFLMGVVTVVAFDERIHRALPALALGVTIVLLCGFMGPLTSASLNPARTLAPAIFTRDLSLVPMYFVSTILGSICGALTIQYVTKK